MADYKTIKGTKIQNYTTDPDNPLTGQVWYNETDQVLKVNTGPLVNAWATSTPYPSERYGLAAAGSKTAAITAGGWLTADAFTFDGTSWSAIPSINTARRYFPGAGTQTAALIFGGGNPTSLAVTESWSGSSWAEVNDLNTARRSLGGAGTQTAALAFGGRNPPISPALAQTESWNGTSWTEVNDLNTARRALVGAGADNTSALAFGGESPTKAITESWNGTSWTEVNDLNEGRQWLGGAGVQTDALAFGGTPPSSPVTAATESWNGTSWTEVNDLNIATTEAGSAGTSGTNAISIAGIEPTTAQLDRVEVWGTSGGNKTIGSS
jgi:hypothetical protein